MERMERQIQNRTLPADPQEIATMFQVTFGVAANQQLGAVAKVMAREAA